MTLVGFASAGRVALRFAAQHPHRLARLAVINASPRFRRGPDWPWGFNDASIDRFVETAREGGIEALTTSFWARPQCSGTSVDTRRTA